MKTMYSTMSIDEGLNFVDTMKKGLIALNSIVTIDGIDYVSLNDEIEDITVTIPSKSEQSYIKVDETPSLMCELNTYRIKFDVFDEPVEVRQANILSLLI